MDMPTPRSDRKPAFADARLGAFQLATMGISALGGYSFKPKKANSFLDATAAVSPPFFAAEEEGLPPSTPGSQPPSQPQPPAQPQTSGQPRRRRQSQQAQGLPHPPPAVLPAIAADSHEAALTARLLSSPRLPWERSPRQWPDGVAPRPLSPRSLATMPPSSPRKQLPPATYTRPPTRADVSSIEESLRAAVEKGGPRDKLDAAWHSAFLELVRQVYVHCNQRGQLLDSVRVYLERQLSDTRVRLREQQVELSQLRREAAVLSGGDGGARKQERSSSPGADARHALMEQQRVDKLVEAAATLPAEALAALVGRLVTGADEEASKDVLTAAIGAAPRSEALTALSGLVSRLPVGEMMDLLSGLLDGVEPSHQQMLMSTFTQKLNAVDRASAALDITNGLDSDTRATLAKDVLLSKTPFPSHTRLLTSPPSFPTPLLHPSSTPPPPLLYRRERVLSLSSQLTQSQRGAAITATLTAYGASLVTDAIAPPVDADPASEPRRIPTLDIICVRA